MFALSSGFIRTYAPAVVVPRRQIQQQSVVYLQKIAVVDATRQARLLDGAVEITLVDSRMSIIWDVVKKGVGNTSEKEIGDLFVNIKNFDACRDVLQGYVKECLNAKYRHMGFLIENVTLWDANE